MTFVSHLDYVITLCTDEIAKCSKEEVDILKEFGASKDEIKHIVKN